MLGGLVTLVACTMQPIATEMSPVTDQASNRAAPTLESTPAPTTQHRATPNPSPKSSASPATPPTSADARAGTSVAVRFKASDGVLLDGREFGTGSVAVVLSHMGGFRDAQGDWYSTAQLLADAGYRAITYNRRGVCPGAELGCSEGIDTYSEHWMDVVGAIRYAKEQGAREVFVAGASIGAMASLHAALEHPTEVAGLIWLAGILNGSGYHFAEAAVRDLEIPKLFMVADRDRYNAPRAARQLHDWAAEPRHLLVVEGTAHGTDLLQPDADPTVANDINQAILEFLGTYSGRSAAE